MKFYKILLISLISLVSFSSLLFTAEEGSPRLGEAGQKGIVTSEDLQGVRAQIETLREEMLRRKTPLTTRSLGLGGIVQTRYTYSEDKRSTSTFSISFLSLSFSGDLRKDYEKGKNLNYFLGLSIDTKEKFVVKPLDVNISYAVLDTLDREKPRLFLIFGQQRNPFGLDPQPTEEKRPTIIAAQFATSTGLNLDKRDLGLVVRGDLFPFYDYGFAYRVPLIEYTLAVFNGAGSNTLDNNKKKDYIARIVLNAPVNYSSPWRGLSVGISHYGAFVTLSSGSYTRTPETRRTGVDFSYVRTSVGLTAEYVYGEDASLSSKNVLSTIKREGYAVTLFYNFGEQFVKGFTRQDRYDDWYPLTYQPFIRFDRWDPNKDKSGDRTDIITLGFNWFFAETTKLQVNCNLKKEETNEVDNNELLVQFQYGF